MSLFEQLSIRHQAKLYWIMRNKVLSWEQSISTRLRQSGFIFEQEYAPQVIQSIILKEYDE